MKLGALASVGGSGCISLLSNPGAVGANELSAFLESLDGAMSAIDARSFFPTAKPELKERVASSEALAKKTLRSLLLVGSVQELPREQMAHADVQARLRASMGEFDDAMFGMTSMLEQLTVSERAEVSTALKKDPQLGMRVMGELDEAASSFGVSMKLRTKLRGISAQACARLRQSPDLAIAEYTGKMHKVAARHGARAEAERRATAALGSSLLWQGEEGGIETSGFHPVVGGALAEPDAGPPPPMVFELAAVDTKPREGGVCTWPEDCPEGLSCEDYQDLGGGKWTRGVCKVPPPKAKTNVTILSAGGVIMGLGVAGLLIVSAATGQWAIGATVGAILGVIGFVILVIGLIVRAVENS